MNYANLKTSLRLQRTLAALQTGDWISTRALIHDADICAVNSCIAELRANGVKIVTRKVKKDRFEYRLEA